MSVGRWIGLVASASSVRHVSTWSGSNSESPIGVALGGEEREAHRPADGEGVDDVEQRLDDAELVADLGAAEHGDERPLRVVAQPEQHLDLRCEQPAHRRRHERRRSDDRGVGAVRGAEGVVDVAVDALDEPLDERSSLASSPGSKRRFSSSSTPGASSASAPRTGSIEYFGSGLPFGRPRWLAVTTSAPRSCSHSIVGRAARMRKSSVIAASSSGTLKSVRTRIRLPSSDAELRLEVLERRDASDHFWRAARRPTFLPAYSMKSTSRLE